jgi:tetratricopeptide (TPR) repeat protein
MYEWFGAREEDLVRAERASQKALQLAPGLVDAHVSRGFTLSLYRRYDEVVNEFEEAIRINPNFSMPTTISRDPALHAAT